MLTVEDVQKQLKRSRASVYRYANTDSELLNPPFDPQKLNPEVRTNREDPLLFHPKEVRRFARDVLGLNPTIEVQTPPETVTQELLRAILLELQSIHELLKSRS
ncbi:resolvase [Pseudanabaena sp. FACHB-2040]|nr:resolvase [Pseudanabaena sp. FACHB-2040]